jgi:3-polyprenyl-4-hydroxybenzoate decarboxylase
LANSAKIAFDSFPDFVNQLDLAGEIKCIGQPVGTELEITKLVEREMKQPSSGKGLFMEQVTANGK